MTKKIRSANWSVGDVSKRSGVPVSTLHYYEEIGLIHALRNAGNQRRYFRDVLRRIAVIKAAQQLGIGLEEIKTALAFLPTSRAPDKSDWQKLSEQWKEQLNQRIKAMTDLRDKMDGCIGCGCLSLTVCPLYNPDDKLGKKQSGAALLSSAEY